jgi:hypothetical protein
LYFAASKTGASWVIIAISFWDKARRIDADGASGLAVGGPLIRFWLGHRQHLVSRKIHAVVVARVPQQLGNQLVVLVGPDDEPAVATHCLHDHGDLLRV